MMNNIYYGPNYASPLSLHRWRGMYDEGRLKKTGYLRYEGGTSSISQFAFIYGSQFAYTISTTISISKFTSLSLTCRRFYAHSTKESSLLATDTKADNNPNNTPIPEDDLWRKEKIAEIYKKKLPAIFEDMSLLKKKGYFATTNFRTKPLSFYSLFGVPGVYMITNKVTKKIYIGMSKNLKARFYNYMDYNRLSQNRTSRIHKALIKYGWKNFSISILEFHDKSVKSSLLREREDFFIKVFKPQYNIKRSKFNLDFEISENYNVKVAVPIPLKVKNLLDASLDPNNLEINLVIFKSGLKNSYYYFCWTTPKYRIEASSKGWSFGDVVDKSGFNPIPLKSTIEKEKIIPLVASIDLEKLAKFFDVTFNRQGEKIYHFGDIKNRFKEKIKALKMEVKKKVSKAKKP